MVRQPAGWNLGLCITMNGGLPKESYKPTRAKLEEEGHTEVSFMEMHSDLRCRCSQFKHHEKRSYSNN
ncbi:hypothetical protein ACFX13_014615 [Malus domestica]